MKRLGPLAYWDLYTVRFILICVHSAFAFICLFLRPYLFEIVHGYAAMAALMPTRWWGLCAALVAICLLVTRRWAVPQMLAQLCSGLLLTMTTIAVSATTGPNLSTMAYGLYGALSLWAFYRVFSVWLYGLKLFQRLQNRIHRRG